MREIMAFEIYKLKKTKSFWGCLIACVAVGLISVLLFWSILKLVNGPILEAAGGYAGDFDALLQMNAFDYGIIAVSAVHFLGIMTAVVVSNLITKDFETGVIRNVAAKSFSRNLIYVSKLFISMMIGAIYVVSFVLSATLMAAVLFRGAVESGTIGTFAKVMLIELLLYMAATSLFVMVSFVTRHGGAAVAVNMALILLVSGLATGIDFIFWGGTEVMVRGYWIFSAIEQSADLTMTGKTLLIDLILVVVTLFATTIVGMHNYNRRDIR